MATADDEPRRTDREESADDATNSSDSDGESEPAEKREWLATTRAKRATAGNRMKAMLANEEPAADDDDLQLLFAEQGDDEGFTDEDKDDASDVQMDSSSDEEDADEGKDDDLEGEKALEQQAREKKAAQRKRKADEAIPMKFRKKVRISQPAADAASAGGAPTEDPKPRPKKKSERQSWLPSAAEAPTRASERATTRSSKEQLHQQMIERERRRKKQMEITEKKAKKAAALKKPPMTQAQRLAEAAVVEKRNAKSLNRWEEAEKQREEERQAKLAAMYNRTLEGPVVTFWSGIVELGESQLKNLGKMVTMEEKAPRKKRQSAAALLAAQQEAERAKESPNEGPSTDSPPTAQSPTTDPKTAESANQPPTETPPQAASAVSGEAMPDLAATPGLHTTNAVFMPIDEPLEPSAPASVATPEAVTPEATPPLAGVLAPPASMMAPLPSSPSPSPTQLVSPTTSIPKLHLIAPPHAPHRPSPLSLPPQTPSDPIPPAAILAPPTATPIATPQAETAQQPPSPVPTPTPSDQPKQANTPTEAASSLDGRITRSCIILQNFDNNAIKDKHVQTQILFGRKMNRIGSTSSAHLRPLRVRSDC